MQEATNFKYNYGQNTKIINCKNCSSDARLWFEIRFDQRRWGHWHFVDADKGDSKTNGVIMG